MLMPPPLRHPIFTGDPLQRLQNWQAKPYSNASSMQFETVYAALQSHNWDSCDPFQHLLDIGCGNGRITAEIAARMPQSTILGIDISADMISFCHECYQPYYHNLSFELMDALALPEKFTENFDTITSFYCLHWVKDFIQALREMHRCLKPKGQIILYVGGQGADIPVLTLLKKQLASPPWSQLLTHPQPYSYYPSIAEIKTQITQLGFIPTYCEEILYPYTYANQTAVLEAAMAIPYALELTPEMRKKCFMEAVVAYLSTLPDRQSEAITVQFPIIRCYANKK